MKNPTPHCLKIFTGVLHRGAFATVQPADAHDPIEYGNGYTLINVECVQIAGEDADADAQESPKHGRWTFWPAPKNLTVLVELIKKTAKLLGFKVSISRIAI